MNYFNKQLKTILTVSFFFLITSLLAQTTNYKSVEDVKGKQVGESVKDFTAKTQNGTDFNLKEELKKGPIVLIFYRGQWCPICNRYLSQIQDSLQTIEKMGARVIAISPEKIENLKKTESKTKGKFTFIYDEGYKIADEFDVKFKPDGTTLTAYNTMLGANLKEAHSDDSQQLPVPATYIINKKGKVVWRHFDSNYKKRADISDILKNISAK